MYLKGGYAKMPVVKISLETDGSWPKIFQAIANAKSVAQTLSQA